MPRDLTMVDALAVLKAAQRALELSVAAPTPEERTALFNESVRLSGVLQHVIDEALEIT